MCKLKSAIVLKDRIFIPDYDSHSKMLDELGIKDDYLGASKKFVRVELSPLDGDPFSDIEKWELTVDQDIVPEWFSKEECKPKMIESVKAWAKGHIHIGVNGLKIENGENHYIKDCKDVTVSGSASVEAWGSASVKAWGSASVKAWGSASVEAWGSASVEAWGSASVEAWGSASVKAWDSASVKAWGSASVKAWGSASVEAWGSASVEAWGSASVKAWDSASVEACGSASVEACGSASVEACGSASVEACGSAIIFNSLYSKWYKQDALILTKNATFKDNIGKVIYQSGDFKLITVESGKKIGDAK